MFEVDSTIEDHHWYFLLQRQELVLSCVLVLYLFKDLERMCCLTLFQDGMIIVKQPKQQLKDLLAFSMKMQVNVFDE